MTTRCSLAGITQKRLKDIIKKIRCFQWRSFYRHMFVSRRNRSVEELTIFSSFQRNLRSRWCHLVALHALQMMWILLAKIWIEEPFTESSACNWRTSGLVHEDLTVIFRIFRVTLNMILTPLAPLYRLLQRPSLYWHNSERLAAIVPSYYFI